MTIDELLTGFKPLGNYAVIKRDVPPETTASGLYIPTQAQDPVVVGSITHVGIGQKNGLNGSLIPMIIEPGDKVVVHPSGIQKVKIEGVEIEIVHEGDVIGYWREGSVGGENDGK